MSLLEKNIEPNYVDNDLRHLSNYMVAKVVIYITYLYTSVEAHFSPIKTSKNVSIKFALTSAQT